MEEQNSSNFLNVDTWIRLLYMLVFGLLLCIARIVIFAVAIGQALFVLVTGEDNKKLRDLGQIAGKWSLQVFYFLTFNSNQKPFPFDDWPELEEMHAEVISGEIEHQSVDSDDSNTKPDA